MCVFWFFVCCWDWVWEGMEGYVYNWVLWIYGNLILVVVVFCVRVVWVEVLDLCVDGFDCYFV